MRRAPRIPRRRTLTGLALAASVAAVVAAGGCGNTSGGPDNEIAGKAAFVKKCGSCHTLARAGTTGVTGPNLDEAFQASLADGFKRSTVEGMVYEQILYPNRTGAMPAKLATGDEAKNIAAYVAASVAKPGKDTGLLADAGKPKGSPEQIFVTNCGSCHTLAAAGTSGKTGPDLNQLKPDAARVEKQVTNGGGGMPAFKGQLTPDQIKKLAAYVAAASQK
ncbi:MAG: c-type cytochrome [Solirubrobacteraceae bacterium]